MPRSLKIPVCVNDAAAASCSIHIPAQKAHSESLRPITFHSSASTRMQARGLRKLLTLYQTPKNTCTGCRVFLLHVYESFSKHHIVRSSHNILLRCLSSILVLVDAALDLVQAVSHLQQRLIRGLSSCWWLLKQHSNPKSQFQYCCSM